jgi:hypothetical protein
MIEMRDNGPEAQTVNDKADSSTQRSVYLPLLRGVTPHTLEAFDPVEQTLVTGSRETTTVPGQALFVLNSSFVRRQSLNLAERLLDTSDSSDEARVQQAYRRTLGREATKAEVDRAKAFIGEYESSYRDNLPPAPAVKPPVPKKKAAAKKEIEPPFDPDQVDQTGVAITKEAVRPKDPKSAAWLAFVQALIGSAEFRYVR